MTSKLDVSYTVTWVSPNVVITYAATYSPEQYNGADLFVVAAPGTTNLIQLGTSTTFTTLDWRKETAIGAGSRSALVSAIAALVPATNYFPSGVETDDITAITGTLVTVNDDLEVVDTLTVDTINEKTAAAGVTIDGTLIKDLAISVDTVNESTTNAGVTVDGVLIKDNAITATGALRGASLTFDGANVFSDFTDRTTWSPSFAVGTNLTGTPAYANSYLCRIGPLVFAETSISGCSSSGAGLTNGILTLPVALPVSLGLAHATGTVYGASLSPVRTPCGAVRNTSGNTTQLYVWFNASGASTVTISFMAIYFAG